MLRRPRLLAVLVVLLLAVAGTALFARRVWRAPGPLPAARAIVVPAGGIDAVAAALAGDGAIRSPLLFRIAVLLSAGAGPVRAGEFAVPAHASLAGLLAILRHGALVEHHLSIPEGLTAREIQARLAAAPALRGPAPLPPEGAVLPATYDYLRGTTRAALLARAEAAMRRTLAHLWAGRDPALALKTPTQALILASIVERETALPAERPIVASVYLNRLARGMRLQADPTVIYAASHGAGALAHPITEGELRLASPFNTYRVAGLPPGPICSPGVAALEAVLHPATTKFLYFVADGSGGHLFARHYASQQRNVARLRGGNTP